MLEPSLDDFFEIFRPKGKITPAAAKCARGANDYREIKPLLNTHGVAHAARVSTARKVQAGFAHGLFKKIPIFRLLDRLQLRSDHLDAVAIENATLRQVDGKVERRLPAKCRQQYIGAFLLNNLLDDIGGYRFDICPIGETGVGHDGCGIRIDEDNSITLFLECFQCLGARIVEFTGLADNDWPGTDEKNGFDVSAFGHGYLAKLLNCCISSFASAMDSPTSSGVNVEADARGYRSIA